MIKLRSLKMVVNDKDTLQAVFTIGGNRMVPAGDVCQAIHAAQKSFFDKLNELSDGTDATDGTNVDSPEVGDE